MQHTTATKFEIEKREYEHANVTTSLKNYKAIMHASIKYGFELQAW